MYMSLQLIQMDTKNSSAAKRARTDGQYHVTIVLTMLSLQRLLFSCDVSNSVYIVYMGDTKHDDKPELAEILRRFYFPEYTTIYLAHLTCFISLIELVLTTTCMISKYISK